MRTPIGKVLTAALALMILALLPLDVHVAIQSPDLFDGQVLHRIDVYLNSDDWRDLRANPTSRTYYPATLQWGTVVARNVGIRSDGTGERDLHKPRLGIDTTWFVSGLTFQGMQSFTLDNLGDDASGIRRVVTTRFYRRMRLPAPRAALAALYVNNTYAGLYVIVESMENSGAVSPDERAAVGSFLGEQFVENSESLGLLDANTSIEGGRALSRTYLDRLLSSADEADRREGPANTPGWLEAEVGRQQRLIADSITSDSFKPWTNREVQQASDRVTWFVRERAAFVRCEVARLLRGEGGCRLTEPSVLGFRQSVVSAAVLDDPSPAPVVWNGPVTNIARGRPYTLAPRPNYSFSSDSGDDVQLTDGSYTVGAPLWTRVTTVGWAGAAPVTIVIDLGAVQPISGVSFSTAAGTSGVGWPRSIFMMVSDDGRRFFAAGDLAARPGAAEPPSSGYAAFRFVTRDLTTHGRYVALIVDPTGPYTFCDEIEILSGDPDWLRSTLTGDSTTDLQKFFVDAHMRVSIQRRLTADLATVRTALEASQVSADVQALSARQLGVAEGEVGALPLRPSDSFRAVLPLNATHAKIFAVQGLLRHTNGFPSLSAWVVNPWDFVRPTDAPPAAQNGSGTLSIAAMAGETRSGAVSFSNSTERAMTVTLRLDSLTASEQTDLRLYEVVWTDTRELIPVADALVPLPDGAPTFEIAAGMTRQLWFSFTPAERAPGTARGMLEATADNGIRVGVPIELRVLPGRFPDRPRLHLGGWDYTDREKILGLTATNREPLIRQLRRLDVDSPWATKGAMPSGSYDVLGRLAVPPDTSTFDRWVSRWPGASRYLVFIDSPDTLGNVAITDGRFPTAAAQWIAFWVAHARTLGIQPSQLLLLLVDEPRSSGQNERIVTWGRAIKAGEPAVRIWENPTYTDPADAKPQLLDVSDVLAMKRSLMLQQGAPFVDFYRQRRARGQALEVYGAAGPARLLDPYSYYRLQAWVCADVGASGSLFWSFADDAGGNSWNEYNATADLYSPFFLSSDSVDVSKHVEAIREGVEDFEYLAMLRDRVDELGRSDPNRAGLSEARRLLENAVTTVLKAPGAIDMQWVADKDRSAAERVRLAVADLLDLLRR